MRNALVRSAIVAATLLGLASCAPQPNAPSPSADGQPRAESDARTSPSPAAVDGSGALLERVLDTGILEIGNPESAATLLIFFNHSCAYCERFTGLHLPRLINDFVRPGKLKLHLIELALRKYPQSELTSTALLCGGMQGKGLPMHQFLVTNEQINLSAVLAHGEELGLDMEKLRLCMENPALRETLKRQASMAESLGVTLVPTFFLNGEKSLGLPDYPDLKGSIEKALREN
ncbi:MAG: thioredoxin domain-containing protein [Candidatus Peregrinibacteria bacterium]|nr:thioredoxin domain-containing protein [Candidatus Peregrinibacteria bacterium]